MHLVHGDAHSVGMADWRGLRVFEPCAINKNPVVLAAPTNPAELAAHYDLTVSHPRIVEDQFSAFDRWLAAAAGQRGLSCALIHDGNVSEVVKRLATGRLTVGYHLDYFALWHVPGNVYAQLAIAVQDAGGRPVNPPARARAFTDKAAAHAELVRNGLGVPPTIVVRPWCADRALTEAECAHLQLETPGSRALIKPANGFSGRGIVRVEDFRPECFAARLTAARDFDRGDSYLIQREMRFTQLPGEDGVPRPAYWRVLGCLGELTAFWWCPYDSAYPDRPSYRAVTPTEIRRHRLQPVLQYAQAVGELAGLDWFSTELCLSDGAESSRFNVVGADGRERAVVAIDYINDQCDVDVQSRWKGAPPDGFVQNIADRFAQEAWRLRQMRLRPATARAA